MATCEEKRIKSELEKILLSKNFMKALKIMEDTNIASSLGISYSHINYVDDLLGMWAQVKVANIPFTNVEKGNIIKITEVITLGQIDNLALYNYGLYVCTIAGKILNINPKKISKMYNNLPIKSKSDINITSKEISDIFGTGKVIGIIYSELEKEILNKNIENNKEAIFEYLKKRK